MTDAYYTDDHVTLYHGDALDVLAGMPDASVDAVVTDPPYNLSFMAKPWDAYEGREDAGFAYWLAGLIDGEGHFAIKRHSRGTHAPYFQLKMRADERGTLDRIKRTTGIGVVSTEDRTDGNPLVKWTVQDKEGCQRLVDLLDKYQLRAKKLDYLTWREAVCEWTERPRGNRWQGGTDNTRMAVLRDRIMATRAYTETPWSGHEYQDWCRLWAQECLRLLKPGGHLLAFGGPRTFHRLTCAIEDAGFEIRDCISYLFGAGFPKSLDVSKAIDRAAGAEREVVGKAKGAASQQTESLGPYAPEYDATIPATDDARRWQGWGTALKPAWEPVIVARKPLAGTVASTVLAHGTGALNIDGCRVGAGESVPGGGGFKGGAESRHEGWVRPSHADGYATEAHTAGRWPANVVLDEDAAAQLDRQSGTSVSRSGGVAGWQDEYVGGKYTPIERTGHDDFGGASRFYYTAKAAPDERPRVNGIAHPTVKPLDLMRWLVRLVTPPGGLVLDPFAGSGTTGEACVIEGFRAVLIEREGDYVPLIEARLSKPIQPTLDGAP